MAAGIMQFMIRAFERRNLLAGRGLGKLNFCDLTIRTIMIKEAVRGGFHGGIVAARNFDAKLSIRVGLDKA